MIISVPELKKDKKEALLRIADAICCRDMSTDVH